MKLKSFRARRHMKELHASRTRIVIMIDVYIYITLIVLIGHTSDIIITAISETNSQRSIAYINGTC